MKKYIFLFITVLIIIGCNSKTNNEQTIAQTDNSLQKVKDAGKLVLGLDDTFAPMGFRDSNREIVGFDIDLAFEVARRIGVELETKPIEWSNSTSILTNGEVDVLWNGVNINEERKKYINFSKPYLNNKLVIVKSMDDKTINSIDDLVGKNIGIQSGGNHEQVANNPIISKMKNINKYDDNINLLLDLQSGRLDAVIIDDIFAQYYINEKKSPFIILENTPLTDGLYAVGFRKSDTELLNEVNRILDEMKNDGTAAKISIKWFGKDIILK
ncbi:amino acid ABC transporter substrate-binding protein [Brachyspira alvinipulli]|uniref:amino acid ABC transporter substrate-binding protein n=1 Tax=Brachyspira alvinipulli TaxID=84379 RepID=UPI00048498C3|nr:amino acid ABC transporter substrate-binding protein [Brachyspira alvinipulli]